jgi:predicted RNA-binding Zn ribbon-like protein
MVAGERHPWHSRSSVQPGGRAPAPGDLALVQCFMNTYYDLEVAHGAEVLVTPAALGEWLHARGLLDGTGMVRERDLRRALDAREGLRAMARANRDKRAGDGAREQLNRAALGASVEVRFRTSGPRFVATDQTGLDGAIGVILAIAARAMLDGSWSRLKLCPGRGCGWAFYDHSRNQAGRWCSMSVCGGRAKARAHYRRRRESS